MHTRWILVHDCNTSPERDNGFPFSCDCVRRINTRDARELVARGRAAWKLRWVGDHRPPVNDRSELILLHVAHPIHAQNISAHDIEAAADGHPYRAARIEAFQR